MNHPKHEEWVPYVFGEAGAPEIKRLEQHLQNCSECRAEIQGWKRSLGRLDEWKLTPAANHRFPWAPVLKWAAAAAVVLAVGFGVGRSTGLSNQAQEIRQAIEPEIREQLRQEFAQMLHRELAQAESQRLADYLALKRDVDTVAVLTDAGLRRAERFFQLAGYAQPASFSKPSNE